MSSKDKSIQELCKHKEYVYNEDETARQCPVCFQLEFLSEDEWIKHPKSEQLKGMLFQQKENTGE